MSRIKYRLWELDDGQKFECPWDGRTGTLISCDTALHTAATVELDPVREGGKVVKKGERLDWSVGTMVWKARRKGKYSVRKG